MPTYKTVWDTEYKLTVMQDDCLESPREWDNLWTLVTSHRSYSWDEELPDDCADIDEAFDEHLSEKWLDIDDIYYHKVWLLDHSWIRVDTSPFWCRWDSWTWWFIYVSIKKATEEIMLVDEESLESRTLDILDSEIETLDKYFAWDIYEFIVEERKTINSEWETYHTDWSHTDSCSWFENLEEMVWNQDIFTLEDFEEASDNI